MIALENPPGFVVRTEARKAAWDNGYRLERLATLWLDNCARCCVGGCGERETERLLTAR
jgi:hypothetical protein